MQCVMPSFHLREDEMMHIKLYMGLAGIQGAMVTREFFSYQADATLRISLVVGGQFNVS